MKNISKENKIRLIAAVLLCVLAFVISYTKVLYPLDKLLSDPLVQQYSVPDPRIKIIAIDERTMAEYGDTSTWSRGIYADLTQLLNSSDTPPAVIAYDILFISDKDPDADEYFASMCAESGNVVTAANLVFQDQVSQGTEGLVVDTNHVAMVEYPYAALRQATTYGFANPVQDKDGYIRSSRLQAEYDGESMYSFAAAIYRAYAAQTGAELHLPETYDNQIFDFLYTGTSGSYEILSMCDVLDGVIPTEAFEDAIVMVGAYAPGMQDAYNVPIQRGTQMYGVEINANILQAMMDGRTGVPVSQILYALIVTIITALFFIASHKLKPLISLVLLIVTIIISVLAGVLLNRGGHTTAIIDLPIMLIVVFLYQLIKEYITERVNKKKVMAAFRQYVAPQIIDKISKTDDFSITLGGERRDVAVLFVDIRGFTPMSEGLEPEEVVSILNEYLELTTTSIFNNGGTLDKFVGDATMAVFNAPFDLDDYIYKAVCTARDIASGSDALEKKLKERFGRSVSFGIGVNCGPAVVGNIGCNFRMDYTAIGDTVNTAARLEANARRGQILISKPVYDALKDRIEVTEIGAIPLKGKSKEVIVYQLDKVH